MADIIPEIRQLKPKSLPELSANERGLFGQRILSDTNGASEQRSYAAYPDALELVARIEEDLTRGVGHYRTKAGLLLTTLDEVTRAILDNNLLEPEA